MSVIDFFGKKRHAIFPLKEHRFLPPIVIIIFVGASAITAVVVVSVYVHFSLPIVLTNVHIARLFARLRARSLSLPSFFLLSNIDLIYKSNVVGTP